MKSSVALLFVLVVGCIPSRGEQVHTRKVDEEWLQKKPLSLAVLDIHTNENPIDPRIQMNMGLIYAMLGNAEQAVMRGRQAMALYPLDKNAINAQRIHIQMGVIYLQLVQVDKCIELLNTFKEKPLGMEVGELKTDATWDPVRDHEVFKAIVQ